MADFTGTLAVGGPEQDATGDFAPLYSGASAAAPADSTAPVVTNVSPPEGTEIERTAPVFFDVTDDSGLFRRVLVAVEFPDGAVELAHDGDAFTPRYIALGERTPIAGGWHFRLRRTGGWPDQPTLRVFATDPGGNEA